jgi:hypothetical protein
MEQVHGMFHGADDLGNVSLIIALVDKNIIVRIILEFLKNILMDFQS